MPFRSAKKRSGVTTSDSSRSNSSRVSRAGMTTRSVKRMRGSEGHENLVLTTPLITAITATTATATTGSSRVVPGTFYWVVSLNGTAPTTAQLKAGTDAGDVAGVDAGNSAIADPNVALITGLTTAVAYFFHAYEESNTTSEVSNIVSSAEFTTL